MDCQACIAPQGAFFLLKAGVPSVKRVKNRVHRSGVPCFLSDYVRAIPSGTAPAHTQDLRLAGGSAYTPEGRQHTQASLRRGVCTSLLKGGGDRVRRPKNAVMGAKKPAAKQHTSCRLQPVDHADNSVWTPGFASRSFDRFAQRSSVAFTLPRG